MLKSRNLFSNLFSKERVSGPFLGNEDITTAM